MESLNSKYIYGLMKKWAETNDRPITKYDLRKMGASISSINAGIKTLLTDGKIKKTVRGGGYILIA
jgi:hypothetical protein